jgi:nicotinamide-nucleotide amidase
VLLADLARRFGSRPDQLREHLRRQVQVPDRGGSLPNRHGTAVGLIYESKPAVIVALPGPPRELQPMVERELVPWLERRFGVRAPGCSLTLRFVGIGQSAIEQQLRESDAVPPGTWVGSQFEGGRVDYTFTRQLDSADDRARLRELESNVRAILGRHLYATGAVTLEEAAMQGIRAREGRLVLLEVASGGALSAGLTRVPGLRGLVAGAWAAGTELDLRRLLELPPEVAPDRDDTDGLLKAMAHAARQRTSAEWVIAVGEGRSPGPNRPPGVRLAFGGPSDRWIVHSIELREAVEAGRANLLNEVLDRWRRTEW